MKCMVRKYVISWINLVLLSEMSIMMVQLHNEIPEIDQDRQKQNKMISMIIHNRILSPCPSLSYICSA